jgi:AcrR family transcriptional regulator
MTGPNAGNARAPRRTGSREAVESAARALFIEKGFDGTSVDEIARRARVSKPTIYAHFGGKEGLFVHVLEAACSRLLAPIIAPTAEVRPVEDVLLDLAHAYTRAVLAPEVISLHRLFVAEAERFPALGQRYYAAGPGAAHLGLAEFLAKRAEAGEIVCRDPLMAAELFAGLVLSPMRLKLLFAVELAPDWDQVDAYSRASVAMFTSYVKDISAHGMAER